MVRNQFGSFSLQVGTGTAIVPGLAGIATTENTRIMLETNNGPGWVLSGIANLSSVMTKITVMSGNINLPEQRIIIGDASNDREALFIGGDMTGTNDGSTANFQIAPGGKASKILQFNPKEKRYVSFGSLDGI